MCSCILYCEDNKCSVVETADVELRIQRYQETLTLTLDVLFNFPY